MYVCVRTGMHACVGTRVRPSVLVCTRVREYTRASKRMCVRAFVRAWVSTWLFASVGGLFALIQDVRATSIPDCYRRIVYIGIR